MFQGIGAYANANNYCASFFSQILYFFSSVNICDALRDFRSNAYKRRSNGWPKRRSD